LIPEIARTLQNIQGRKSLLIISCGNVSFHSSATTPKHLLNAYLAATLRSSAVVPTSDRGRP